MPNSKPSTVTDNNGNMIPTASPSTPPPATMDASAIAQNNFNAGFQFPQNQPNPSTTAANAMTTNASITNPIPSVESITGEQSQQTPAEQTNQGLLGRLAGLIGGKSSLATLQTQQEGAGGVPGLTKTLDDLNAQLEGVNNESTALANAAQPGGAIENQQQLNATGRGITAGGLAPLTAAEMRKNQIAQSANASRALTLKSAVYAAQGNLALAKDAADKAAQVTFDAEQQDIDYVNALIAQNAPQMNKEEQAQAATVQAKLADRQTQINQQIDDHKSGQAMVAAALKLNPNDPQAQFAAQQAMKLNPNDPDYLTKVMNLVGQYQQNPLDAVAQGLSIQIQREQLKALKADPGIKTQLADMPDGSKALINSQTGEVIKSFAMPANISGLAPAIQQKVDEQNALDAQTVSSAYQGITGTLAANGITDPSNITETQVDKLSDIQIENIAKNLARMQNPDIARQGGDAGNALAPQSLIEKYKQAQGQALGGRAYLSSKVVDAIKSAAELEKSRGLSSLSGQTQDTQIVNGKTFVKAADGLYYPQ